MTFQHQAQTLQTRGKLAWGKEPALILALLMQIPFTLRAVPDLGQSWPWEGGEEPFALRFVYPGQAVPTVGSDQTLLAAPWPSEGQGTAPELPAPTSGAQPGFGQVENDREQSPAKLHCSRAWLFPSAHLTETQPAPGWQQHNPESLFSYITMTPCIFNWNLPFICVLWQPEGGIQRCSWRQVGIPEHLKLRRHYSAFQLEELCPDAPCSQQALQKGLALNTLSQDPASAEKKKLKMVWMESVKSGKIQLLSQPHFIFRQEITILNCFTFSLLISPVSLCSSFSPLPGPALEAGLTFQAIHSTTGLGREATCGFRVPRRASAPEAQKLTETPLHLGAGILSKAP